MTRLPDAPTSPLGPPPGKKPPQDLQSAALLCEAAYRTHFSDDELHGHMAAVRSLLSQAEVGDMTVHTAGDQRCASAAPCRQSTSV